MEAKGWSHASWGGQERIRFPLPGGFECGMRGRKGGVGGGWPEPPGAPGGGRARWGRMQTAQGVARVAARLGAVNLSATTAGGHAGTSVAAERRTQGAILVILWLM